MATQPLEIKLKTLTPLWTGGVDGTMIRLHETGIIGSLRWWYEVIVRGLGGWACDPSEHGCPDKEGRICDACALFGATGIKRAFRIDWDHPENPSVDRRLKIRTTSNNRGWFLGRGLFSQNIEGILLSTRFLDWISQDEMLQMLGCSLSLADKWGGLGARTQQGYGVTEIQTSPDLNIRSALITYDKLQKRASRRSGIGHELPKLNEFFFAKVKFPKPPNPEGFVLERTSEVDKGELQFYINQNVLPIAPVLRYHLRGLIRNHIVTGSGANAPARWYLMGVLNGRYHQADYGKLDQDRWYCSRCRQTWTKKPTVNQHQRCQGRPYKQFECQNCRTWFGAKDKGIEVVQQHKSLLQVSHAYAVDESNYEFRIWGWIPINLPGQISRNEVLKYLKQWLGAIDPSLRNWQAAQRGGLWNSNRVSLPKPSIIWMEKEAEETGGDFLQALLNWGDVL